MILNEVRQFRKAKQVTQSPISAAIKPADTEYLVTSYLAAIGSPTALKTFALFRAGQHADIVKMGVNPHDYECPTSFRNDYAAAKFLSKCADLATGIDTRGVALQGAQDAEDLCRQTNLRLRQSRVKGVNPSIDSLLFRAKSIISSILDGVEPQISDDPGWSPGRSTSASGQELAAVYKYAAYPDSTASCVDLAVRLINSSPHWGQAALAADGPTSIMPRGIRVVEGNVMMFVPKNAKTDRVICYEPHMNIRLQRIVGSALGKALRKCGVDLRDQSINQRKCRRAAKFGDLATVDLSMASDTLSIELVWELLPYRWACLLDKLRSKYTLWPDKVLRRNEKFSSMGNGFTFELESMIFYALARACTENVSVYGDDIILPTGAVEEFTALLGHVGFKINSQKSYSSSYFRESCGVDVFRSLDCTPVYLRRLPKTIEDVAKLHNAISAWVRRYNLPLPFMEKLMRTWRSRFPFLQGPQGFGDGHYHVAESECLGLKSDKHGCDLVWFRTVVRRSRVSPLYGDLVHGAIPPRYASASICAALGPPKGFVESPGQGSLISNLTDPRQFVYKTIWVPVRPRWQE